MTIETKELNISDELKRKIEMICRFAYVDYSLENSNIKSIKNINIAYVKTHILKVKNNDYLIFEECDDIFIKGYTEKIKFKVYKDAGIRAKNDKRPAYQQMMHDAKDKKIS